MTYSFDFDGVLTEEKFRMLAKTLAQTDKVIILTGRLEADFDVLRIARDLGIEEIHFTSHKDKFEYILEHDLQVDIHFDDDYFECEGIAKNTKVIPVLVDIDFYPEVQQEIHPEEIKPQWKCSACGSLDVETQVWMGMNDGEIKAGDDSGNYYCPSCEENCIIEKIEEIKDA